MANISNGLRARGIGTGAKLVGDAAVGDVRAAKTFMNVSGEAVGTLPVRDSGGPTVVNPGVNPLSLLAGIYDNNISIAGDADLIADNIKSGINMFGVAGKASVVDTSAGDAIAANILSGKKAYVNGALVTGNILSKAAATITPGTVNQSIAAGQFLSGAQTIAGDADLIAANIKTGVDIFGVAGHYSGIMRTIATGIVGASGGSITHPFSLAAGATKAITITTTAVTGILASNVVQGIVLPDIWIDNVTAGQYGSPTIYWFTSTLFPQVGIFLKNAGSVLNIDLSVTSVTAYNGYIVINMLIARTGGTGTKTGEVAIGAGTKWPIYIMYT